jgi:chemotaxis protein MotA
VEVGLTALIGLAVVAASVVLGYVMHGGDVLVLFQVNEFIIIGGAAFGSMLVGTPIKTLRLMSKQLGRITRSGPSKQDYLDLLVMLYELLTVARRDGLLALEPHIEEPQTSKIISKYPSFLKNEHAVHFFTDTMRLIIGGAVTHSHDLENLMDVELDAHHDEKTKPSRVLQTVGDALPGLGIVAAVLGIVITMQSIDGPPEEIGHKVGAALVGTFLGVLLSYGFVQPLAQNLTSQAEAEGRYVLAIRQVLLGFQKGTVPQVAVEFARRALYSDVRPGYEELEASCRGVKAATK